LDGITLGRSFRLASTVAIRSLHLPNGACAIPTFVVCTLRWNRRGIRLRDNRRLPSAVVAGCVSKMGGLRRRIDRGSSALGPCSPQYVSMRWSIRLKRASNELSSRRGLVIYLAAERHYTPTLHAITAGAVLQDLFAAPCSEPRPAHALSRLDRNVSAGHDAIRSAGEELQPV
jgi:hypothetical protein